MSCDDYPPEVSIPHPLKFCKDPQKGRRVLLELDRQLNSFVPVVLDFFVGLFSGLLLHHLSQIVWCGFVMYRIDRAVSFIRFGAVVARIALVFNLDYLLCSIYDFTNVLVIG